VRLYLNYHILKGHGQKGQRWCSSACLRFPTMCHPSFATLTDTENKPTSIAHILSLVEIAFLNIVQIFHDYILQR